MFILNKNVLEAGDILLTAQKGLVSKAVRKFTKSDFSHAILYVGNMSYIHSDGDGVHSGNIQRLIFKNQDNVRVLRVPYKDKIDTVCTYARTQIGKEYSVNDAIKTQNPFSRKKPSNRQFCSRLVAQAYEYAGLPLVTDCNYCTPQDLENSTLTYIINNCTIAINEAEMELANNDNPLKEQTRITNEILKSVRALTQNDLQTLTDLPFFLQKNPKYDADISQIIERSGYLNMWKSERSKNAWRYEGHIFANLPIPLDEKLNLAKEELENAKKRMDLYFNNLTQYDYIYQNTGLQYAKIHIELYRNLVAQTKENINAANYVLKKKQLI